MPIRMRSHDCFNVCNILINEEKFEVEKNLRRAQVNIFLKFPV